MKYTRKGLITASLLILIPLAVIILIWKGLVWLCGGSGEALTLVILVIYGIGLAGGCRNNRVPPGGVSITF